MTRAGGAVALGGRRRRPPGRGPAGAIAIAISVVGLVLALAGAPTPPAEAAPGDWPTYLATNGRSGFNATETTISAATASTLRLRWTYQAGDVVATQPVVANGLVYFGSWDGYERAVTPSGGLVWQTYLGKSVEPCASPQQGVSSTAAVATEQISGVATSVLYAAGGDGELYALDALNGATLWRTSLGSSAAGVYLWSSPAVFGGSVYIGVASLNDCPLVQGRVVQLDDATGAVRHTFNVVPDGCTGGTVWGSPTIDEASGTLFVATGNLGACAAPEPYAEAVLSLRAADLALLGSWQVPASQRVADGDFGSTPTLFTATVGGAPRPRLGVANKNGIYYAFDRTSVGAGPVWRAKIAVGGDCPTCGQGSIAPSAWDGRWLYVAGGNTKITGTSCQGSVRALNPANGNPAWQACLATGPVLGAVTAAPGVVAVGAGDTLFVLAASTGQRLFTYRTPPPTGGSLYGAASISQGVLYQADSRGTLYAFGT